MKYFFDTEFIEDGKAIDLISIGMVCEDGREMYAVNIDCDFSKADDWVLRNVLLPIGIDREGFRPIQEGTCTGIQVPKGELCSHKHFAMSKEKIAKYVLDFIGYTEEGFYPNPDFMSITNTKMLRPMMRHKHYVKIKRRGTKKTFPEFWADYCSYDWVVLCQLFGKMIDLPKGMPMFCNDIQQLYFQKETLFLPSQASQEHNALEDARHVKTLYDYLSVL